MLGNKVIIFTDDVVLKFILIKKEIEPRLMRWILLMQEFDIEIKDKCGVENFLVYHISHFSSSISTPICDSCLDEHIFQIIT